MRRGGQPNTLHRLTIVLEELNSQLQTLEGQGFFVGSRTLQDQDKLAAWTGELVFGIYLCGSTVRMVQADEVGE